MRRQKDYLIFEKMYREPMSSQLMLFFMLYGITGVMPFVAAVYLLLRRGNAFAPDVTPPMRLRRWTASFFLVSALAHVWWYLFYIYSTSINSVVYMVLVVLDSLLLFFTIAGTQLAMLQDRRRPIWPILIAMIPFVVLCGFYMAHSSELLRQIALAYILLLCLLFNAYMVFAIRQYGRWLNDNYADLENKKVWLSQVVAFLCLLLFVLYVLAEDIVFISLIHFVDIVLVVLLLWRVETLPQLEETHPKNLPVSEGSDLSPLTSHSLSLMSNIDLSYIEQLLAKHCVDTQLYLQHDITLQQLAQTIGTNRSYLSQYFSRQGITYNTYINNLRINHFIKHYEEATAAGQPVSAQQLAYESGFRSYRTFSRAFMQRTGQSVTAWTRNMER